eukprot:3686974-Alexandrium_andersonii.AAC.1
MRGNGHVQVRAPGSGAVRSGSGRYRPGTTTSVTSKWPRAGPWPMAHPEGRHGWRLSRHEAPAYE